LYVASLVGLIRGSVFRVISVGANHVSGRAGDAPWAELSPTGKPCDPGAPPLL
jgi:hypothetical protein